jgi:hypothetical protein
VKNKECPYKPHSTGVFWVRLKLEFLRYDVVTRLYINIFADVFVFVLQLCVRKWILYFYFIVCIIFNFYFYYYFLYCWFPPYPSGGDQFFSQVICILPSCISKHLEKIDYQYINNIIIYIIFIVIALFLVFYPCPKEVILFQDSMILFI